MIIAGKLFTIYKRFYRRVFKALFFLIRKIVLFLTGKDIIVILNSVNWVNTKSMLFFYTDIRLDEYRLDDDYVFLDEKHYPVKKFKIKWYLWLMYYVWALWVVFKIILTLTVYFSYRFVTYELWKTLWLILLEYWRFRFGIMNWILWIIWHIWFVYTFLYLLWLTCYEDWNEYEYAVLNFFRIYKYWIKIGVNRWKYVRQIDKSACLSY